VIGAPLPASLNGGDTSATRTPGGFATDCENVKTTTSAQRAVWRTATAVKTRGSDGGGLVKWLSGCRAGPHGAVGGGPPVVVEEGAGTVVVEGGEEVVVDESGAVVEVDDPLDLVVLLASPPPPWHAEARTPSTTRATKRCAR
jgi:hypothetical protein